MIKKISIIIISLFFIFLIVFPEISKVGVYNGIIICGKIVIPSLFPFMMCCVFIINTGLLSKIKLPYKISKILGLNSYSLFTFLLSFIGGFPIGAKLINNGVLNNQISKKEACVMLNFCVNAGPAFILSVIGVGIFKSKLLGFLILFSHCIVSVFIYIFYRVTGKIKYKSEQNVICNTISPVDNFVLSASESAKIIMNICVFVIIFSCVNTYIMHLPKNFHFLCYFTEITNSLTYTRNIYLISFLLGFSGICIWFQIFSICKNFKISYLKFILSRLIHGTFSTFIFYMLVKIFKISISVNAQLPISFKLYYQSPVVSLSLIVTVIVFIISLTGKKYNGKITEEII